MEITTKSGFSCKLDDDVFDDYELLETFQKIDDGEMAEILKVAPKLLGEKQTEKLKDHVRSKKGRVSLTGMVHEIYEIISEAKQGKNS